MKEFLKKRIIDNEGLIGFLSCYLIMAGLSNITDPASSTFDTWWGWTILFLSVFNVYPYFRKLIFAR